MAAAGARYSALLDAFLLLLSTNNMSTISSYTLKSGPRAAAGETPLFAVAD
jgi:hypothetical protein